LQAPLPSTQTTTAPWAAARTSGCCLRPCVVTGAFFDQAFLEPVSRRYLPGPVGKDTGEIEVAAFDDDDPETLPEEGVDLLELVHELLALGLDPHPRAPGADLAQLGYEPEEADLSASPFAALAGMKPAPGG